MLIDLEALRESPFDLLLEMEKRIRESRVEFTSNESQTWTGLAFRLRDRWFLAPQDDVREVVPLPPLTRVPGAAKWLLGLANVHGLLLPVSDLGALLGMPLAPNDRNARIMVFNSEQIPAALLVDEVSGLRQFVPADQRHEFAHEATELAPYLLGAFARDGRPWLVLSLRKLAESPIFVAVEP